MFVWQKFKEPFYRDWARRRRGRRLDEVGGYGSEPKAAQGRALGYLIDHEAIILEIVLLTTAGFANKLRSGGGLEAFEDPPGIEAVMPHNMSAAQAVSRIKITRICVSEDSRIGMAYLEIQGECAWDPEHGFEVVLHRDRVVAVHQQGTGWRDTGRRRR